MGSRNHDLWNLGGAWASLDPFPWAYYKKMPLPRIRDIIEWESNNIFPCHYLCDMAVYQDLNDLPVVAAWTA